MKAARVVYVFVYVTDLKASRAFYEEVVGLRVLEEDPEAVKYDVGDIILALNSADHYRIDVGAGRGSSLLVFHVDDIDHTRAILQERGAIFDETLRYEIGATAAFYDPDGHCLTLYEPSAESMTWPSAEKYRELLLTPVGLAGEVQIRCQEHLQDGDPHGPILGPLVYLFLFVRDTDEAFQFYHGVFGLPILENDEEGGVVKYDGGGVIIATHPIEGESPDVIGSHRPKSMSVVFHVDEIEAEFEELSSHIRFASPLVRSAIGALARFDDPTGHMFYLYHPSPQAMEWPSGAKLRHMLQRTTSDAAAPTGAVTSPP